MEYTNFLTEHRPQALKFCICWLILFPHCWQTPHSCKQTTSLMLINDSCPNFVMNLLKFLHKLDSRHCEELRGLSFGTNSGHTASSRCSCLAVGPVFMLLCSTFKGSPRQTFRYPCPQAPHAPRTPKQARPWYFHTAHLSQHQPPFPLLFQWDLSVPCGGWGRQGPWAELPTAAQSSCDSQGPGL